MSTVSTTTPSVHHLALRRALEGAIAQHGATLDAVDLLAVTSHLVGQLIALQDQRRYTPALVMQLVQENIEQGNSEVVNSLLLGEGGRA